MQDAGLCDTGGIGHPFSVVTFSVWYGEDKTDIRFVMLRRDLRTENAGRENKV